jgi:molecular chaperone GrpE (heat shock protein)
MQQLIYSVEDFSKKILMIKNNLISILTIYFKIKANKIINKKEDFNKHQAISISQHHLRALILLHL